MLTHDFQQYYLDCEETGAPELIWVASKSGSMNACRNDGGIVHTPYGEYVIVLMNKDFHDIIEYNDPPAIVYGARVSRMIQDQVLGELKLDKDYDTFEGEIPWCGKDVSLSLEVNAESKPSWTRARSAAKKLLADCDTWDKAMRELAAKNLTELANNWLSQDEENPRDPETDPITEEELARRISMTSLSVTSGGSFTAWFDCDEMFTDHAVTVYGSLKKGLKTANIEG